MIARFFVLSGLILSQAPGETAADKTDVAKPEKTVPIVVVPPQPNAVLTRPPQEVPPLAPGGGSPRFGIVEGVIGNNLLIRAEEPEAFEFEYVKFGVKSDKDKTKQWTIKKETAFRKPLIKIRKHALNTVQAFDLNGRKVSAEGIREIYRQSGLALFSEVGQSVDPAFLKVVRDNVLLLCLPELEPTLYDYELDTKEIDDGGYVYKDPRAYPVQPGESIAKYPALKKNGAVPRFLVIEGFQDGHVKVRKESKKKIGFYERTIRTTRDNSTMSRSNDRLETLLWPVEESAFETISIPLEGIAGYEADGKPIPTEKLERMYTRPGLALYTVPGHPVDPAFLKATREGVPLIVVNGLEPVSGKAVPVAR